MTTTEVTGREGREQHLGCSGQPISAIAVKSSEVGRDRWVVGRSEYARLFLQQFASDGEAQRGSSAPSDKIRSTLKILSLQDRSLHVNIT